MSKQLIVAACLALGAAAWAQTGAPGAMERDAVTQIALHPSSKVLGLEVRNDSQKNLGEIGDLLIDPRSGEIRYAVLDVGGFLGLGEEHRLVPWSFIQIVADEKDREKIHARSKLSEDQVKSAPTCKKDEKKVAADLDRRIEATFGKDERWAYSGKGEPMFVWCRQMDGVVVKDPANKEVGKVQNVILAPANNCVAFVVLDTTEEAGDKHVALPFVRVEYSYDQDNKLKATTPVEISKFAMAPEYDEDDWKRMSSTAWMNELATYYKCEPFWKSSRFASARKEPAKSN